MMHHQRKMNPPKMLAQIAYKILYAASVHMISPNPCKIWKKILLQIMSLTKAQDTQFAHLGDYKISQGYMKKEVYWGSFVDYPQIRS